MRNLTEDLNLIDGMDGRKVTENLCSEAQFMSVFELLGLLWLVIFGRVVRLVGTLGFMLY